MSAPKNIQRDATFIRLQRDERKVDWNPTVRGVGTSKDGRMNSLDTVFIDFFGLRATNTTAAPAITPGSYSAVGGYIQQPLADRAPYRIKATVNCPAKGADNGMILIGYRDSAAQLPSGVFAPNAAVIDAYEISFKGEIDVLVMVDPVETGQPNDGSPLAIALAFTPHVATDASDFVLGQLSVQNLGVKPPTMQNAVS